MPMKRSPIPPSKRPSYVVLPESSKVEPHDGVPDLLPQLLSALLAYKDGNFAVRLPNDWTGVACKIADGFNEVVSLNQRLTSETARVSRAVGKEGKLRQRVNVAGVTGDWANEV